MPIRIRWNHGKFLGLGLMIIGLCGLFQVIYIILAQYIFLIGSLYAIILIPIGATIGLILSAIIIFEGIAEVDRRRKIKSQFRKKSDKDSKFFSLPIVRPLLICFISFTLIYILSFSLSLITLTSLQSFIIAENISTISCIFIANFIERNWAKIKR
jgi:hypothetical protein